MPNNIKIADKPTLDEVRNTTGEINDKIGNPADLENAGSVMGKLNKVLSDASTNMGYVMAGEGVAGTISTATVTATANGTKRARVGNFTVTHAGKGSIVVTGSFAGSGGGWELYFFVSATNTASPSASTEAGAICKTQKSTRKNHIWMVDISSLPAGTYYVYAVIVNTTTTTPDLTVDSIHASVSYATTTPCQSIVKSVQRGVWDMAEGDGVIPITNVAPEKCLVLVNGATLFSGRSDSEAWGNNVACKLQADRLFFFWKASYLSTNEGTNLGEKGSYATAESATYYRTAIFWQIIEFY